MAAKNVPPSNAYEAIVPGSSDSGSDEEERPPKQKVYNEQSPLVNTRRTPTQSNEPEIQNHRNTQYLSALIVTIGGFIAGTSLGWTSPAGPMLEKNLYGFIVSEANISWIGALMPLGALFGCPAMAGLVNKLGRKDIMLILTIPTLLGWTLIIFAKSVSWIYVGRFLNGFSSGSYSVIVPLYTSEIAEKEIRGTLGSYFQLQVNAGILFSYILGNYLDIFYLSIACATIPIILIYLMIFVPESPVFHLMKGNVNKAKESLRYFRGAHRNVDEELYTMKNFLAKTERERIPVIKAFQTISAQRCLFLGLGLMIFQQFTGANAVIFYATSIFYATGSKIEPNVSTIIIGIMAVISTYISTLIVDKLGRKILLLFSIVIMGISTFFIGVFFYLKSYDVSVFGFIPLVSLCSFIILFSMGFGPVPWMMMGEIFPAQIKGTASSIVCMANWFFAFLVTKFFLVFVSAIHIYNTFWLFTLFSVLGTFFVLFIVPETKGKTLEEIQELLGADHSPLLPENRNQNESNE